MSVYTAGIPAEYGRKMGGVVEVNSVRDARTGFHGELVLSGGSFDTASAYTMLQYLWGKNLFGVSASGAMTSRYLSPPVPENYTNNGTTGDFSASYERDFTPNDRLSLMFRHELARYSIPNEQVQQEAWQQLRKHGDCLLSTCVFLKRGCESCWNGSRQLQRPVVEPALDSHHRFPEQSLYRGIFQRNDLHSPRQPGVEGRRRIGQHFPARALRRRNHRSFAIRSRHTNYVQLHWQSPRPRAVSVRPRSDSSGQLDHRCRRSLGPLPTHRQSERGQPSPGSFSLLRQSRTAGPRRL